MPRKCWSSDPVGYIASPPARCIGARGQERSVLWQMRSYLQAGAPSAVLPPPSPYYPQIYSVVAFLPKSAFPGILLWFLLLCCRVRVCPG